MGRPGRAADLGARPGSRHGGWPRQRTPRLANRAHLADLQNRMWNQTELKLNKLQIATFPHPASQMRALARRDAPLCVRPGPGRGAHSPAAAGTVSFHTELVCLGTVYLNVSADEVLATERGVLNPLLKIITVWSSV